MLNICTDSACVEPSGHERETHTYVHMRVYYLCVCMCVRGHTIARSGEGMRRLCESLNRMSEMHKNTMKESGRGWSGATLLCIVTLKCAQRSVVPAGEGDES